MLKISYYFSLHLAKQPTKYEGYLLYKNNKLHYRLIVSAL